VSESPPVSPPAPHTRPEPVSVPPHRVVYVAAGLIAFTALAGAGFGFRTGFHNGQRPGFGGADQTQATDNASIAKPIVDVQALEQQAPIGPAAANSAEQAAADSNAIALRTAAAEQVQAKSATSTASIDDVLASSSERPQAPARPSTDEQAPSTGKNDVPF